MTAQRLDEVCARSRCGHPVARCRDCGAVTCVVVLRAGCPRCDRERETWVEFNARGRR